MSPKIGEERPPFAEWLKAHVFTATDLENYRLCPYRFYASAYLKLKPEDPFEVELKPSEIGSLVHRVLERLLRGEVSREKASAFLDNELTSLEAPRPHLSKPLLELQRARLQRMLDGFVGDFEREGLEDLGWKPRFFEWEFGNSTPPLVLKDADGLPVSFRGRIDRIDVNEAKKQFLVIDYKTGSTKITGNQIKSGEALQLPLYLLAVRNLLLKGYEPAGAVYHQLSDMTKKDGLLHGERVPSFLGVGPRSSSLVAPAKWDGVFDLLFQTIGRTVSEIRKTPEDGFVSLEDPCDAFCPYQDICLLRSVCGA
jgi:ATP-dependent helicase/DNAse subunit B